VSASKSAMPVMPIAPSISPCGDFGAGNCTVCSCALTMDAKRLCLDSRTLLGKKHGAMPDMYVVCGHDCKKKFDTPRKREGKKQQEVINRLYSDVMKTDVRVGDTVQVHGDISNGRYVEGCGWGLVERVHYDWLRCCAEISVKALDTTVLVWPAGVRRIDDKENEGRLLRQRGEGGGVLVERDRNREQMVERLAVKCDSQSKRAAGSEAAIAEAARLTTALEASRAALRRERERAHSEAGAFIYIESVHLRGACSSERNPAYLRGASSSERRVLI
jgi:hypothetical protein